LERRTVDAITATTGKAQWEVFAAMDDLLQDLAADADERLAWQAQFPTTPDWDCMKPPKED
jgi:hypothetical protein